MISTRSLPSSTFVYPANIRSADAIEHGAARRVLERGDMAREMMPADASFFAVCCFHYCKGSSFLARY